MIPFNFLSPQPQPRATNFFSPIRLQSPSFGTFSNHASMSFGRPSPAESAVLQSVLALLNLNSLLSLASPQNLGFQPVNGNALFPRPLTLETGSPLSGVSNETKKLFPHFGTQVQPRQNQSDLQYAESVLQKGARDWDGDGKISNQDKIKTVEFFRATRKGSAQTDDLNGDGRVTADERARKAEYQALSDSMDALFPGGRTEATYQLFGFRQK